MREAWRLLRSENEQLIDDVANGRRLFWLGSGISRDQVPDLVQLLRRVLLFLRQRAGSGEGDAAHHRAALLEILEDNLPSERAKYDDDPMGWEPGDLESLRDRYSRVLGVGVEGKPTDYLLIDGAGLPELYGDPALQPGPTHLLLAMLISEGCATQFASGNWDGLVEKALSEISGSDSLIDVYVDVDDPRDAHGHSEIAKFHGCAVLALAQPDRYRGKIIATNAQISKLHGDPEFAHMKDHLRDLTTRKRSLILGLSVQDSDLLAIFRGAASRSPWRWDPNHPAYLFAEPAISASQRDVLEVAYGEEFGHERTNIIGRSALGAYAGPVVAAVLLEVLAAKMIAAMERHQPLNGAVLASLHEGIRRLITRIVARYGRDESALAEFLLGGYSDLVRTYLGPLASGDANYLPFARATRNQLSTDPAVVAMGLDLLAIALGVLGLGERAGRWRVSLPIESKGSRISISRRSGGTTTTVIVVRSAAEAIAAMESDDWVEGEGEMVLLQMQNGPSALSRSPGGRIGRGRAARSRHDLSWSALSDSVSDVDELMARFEAGAKL